MKNLMLKFAIILVCILALGSSVQASTISVQPYFKFVYSDPNFSSHTYTIYYSIENSDHVFTQAYYIGNSTTYPPNAFWNTYQSGSYITVTEPAGPPIPVLCYRIAVLVVRNDYAKRVGYSVWATAADLQNNSLTITVPSF
ncbi:MAG: hypothetical protein WCO02_08680 [Bacteroidota bacterium]